MNEKKTKQETTLPENKNITNPTLKLESNLGRENKFFSRGRLFLFGLVLLSFLFVYYRSSSLKNNSPIKVFKNVDKLVEIIWIKGGVKSTIKKQDKKWKLIKTKGVLPLKQNKTTNFLDFINNMEAPLSTLKMEPHLFSQLILKTEKYSHHLKVFKYENNFFLSNTSKTFQLTNQQYTKLFPNLNSWIQRNVIPHDLGEISKIKLFVQTAAGRKRYLVSRQNNWWITGKKKRHHTNTRFFNRYLQNIKSISMQKLLKTNFSPEKKPLVTIFLNNQEKIEIYDYQQGNCPQELSGLTLKTSDQIKTFCTKRNLKNKLIPSLPQLLEPRVLPFPPASPWTKIEVEHDSQTEFKLIYSSENRWDLFCNNKKRKIDKKTGIEWLKKLNNSLIRKVVDKSEFKKQIFSIKFTSQNKAQWKIKGGKTKDGSPVIIREGEDIAGLIREDVFELLQKKCIYFQNRRLIPEGNITSIARKGLGKTEVLEIIKNKAIISKPLSLPFSQGLLQEIMAQIQKAKIETFLSATKIKDKLDSYYSTKTIEKINKTRQITKISSQEKSLLNPENSLQFSINFSEKKSSKFYIHKNLPLGRFINKNFKNDYFSLNNKLHQKLIRPWIPNKIFSVDPMEAETIKFQNNTLIEKNDYWLLTRKDGTKKIITSEKLNNHLKQLIVLFEKIKPIYYADNLEKIDFTLVFFSKNNKNQHIEVQKIKDGYYLKNQLWFAIFQLKTEKDILQILKF